MTSALHIIKSLFTVFLHVYLQDLQLRFKSSISGLLLFIDFCCISNLVTTSERAIFGKISFASTKILIDKLYFVCHKKKTRCRKQFKVLEYISHLKLWVKCSKAVRAIVFIFSFFGRIHFFTSLNTEEYLGSSQTYWRSFFLKIVYLKLFFSKTPS